MDLGCIFIVKLIGLPDKLDVGSKGQREIQDDCGIWGMTNCLSDHFME